MARLEVRLDEELKREFEELARSQGKTVSDVIRELLQTWVALARNGIELKEVIKEAIKKGEEEAKLILTLQLSGRYGGCGYLCLWGSQLIKLLGDVEVVTLSYDDDQGSCERVARIAVIPKSTPVIIAVYEEDDCEGNCLELHVFDGKGWHCVTVNLGDIRLDLSGVEVLYEV